MPNDMPFAEISMGDSTYASPVFANGTLYVTAKGQLYAIRAARTP